jgi:general secretion pathway protein F/type IV pilus assembly protein PilC
MTAMISPVIILIMAVVVGVVAYSIISAVFQSVNGIKSRV